MKKILKSLTDGAVISEILAWILSLMFLAGLFFMVLKIVSCNSN